MAFHRRTPDAMPLPRRAAFTLVEMIAVMAIIIALTAIIVPAFKNIKGSGDFTAAAGGIAGKLEQARAYAMANNTYVYVGIGEYLVTEASSASPRTPGTGELAVAVVAARNGTRGYDVNSPAATWANSYSTAGGGGNGLTLLTAIDKLTLYDNVHLADFGGNPPSTGNMARPAVTDPTYRLGSSSYVPSANPGVCTTPFAWPLGMALTQGQYNFTQVVQIDPQGVARIQTATNTDSIAPWIELDLQPTNGAVAPASTPANQNVGNQGAVMIDCMTGAVRTYRP